MCCWTVALNIATRVGDTPTAISAVEQLVENFQVDELDKTYETLAALAKRDRDSSASSQILKKARGLIDEAIRDEQFDKAAGLCQIASAAARQLGDREAAGQLIAQAEFVADCQKAFKDVQRILTSTQDADDPEGNLRVGRYYCLIRGDWDRGLPLLAKGCHAQLRGWLRRNWRILQSRPTNSHWPTAGGSWAHLTQRIRRRSTSEPSTGISAPCPSFPTAYGEPKRKCGSEITAAATGRPILRRPRNSRRPARRIASPSPTCFRGAKADILRLRSARRACHAARASQAEPLRRA